MTFKPHGVEYSLLFFSVFLTFRYCSLCSRQHRCVSSSSFMIIIYWRAVPSKWACFVDKLPLNERTFQWMTTAAALAAAAAVAHSWIVASRWFRFCASAFRSCRVLCLAWCISIVLFFFYSLTLHLFCFYTQTCLPTWGHVIISIEATSGDEKRWWCVHVCVCFCSTMHGISYKCAQNTMELSVHYISSALFAAEPRKQKEKKTTSLPKNRAAAAAAARNPFSRSSFLCPHHFHKYVKLFER